MRAVMFPKGSYTNVSGLSGAFRTFERFRAGLG